jgi:hypothetical protein
VSTTTQTSDKPLEEPLRLPLDEPVDLDVAWCDVFRAREPNQAGPFEMRFRGTKQPDGLRVRGFVPLLEIEGPLIHAGALLQPVNVDALGPGERAFVAVPLVKFALTLTKRRKGNGHWLYEVAVRDGAQAVDLAQYLRSLHDAADHAVPVLQAHGYSVGAAEVISIAGTLFAARINRGGDGTNGTR